MLHVRENARKYLSVSGCLLANQYQVAERLRSLTRGLYAAAVRTIHTLAVRPHARSASLPGRAKSRDSHAALDNMDQTAEGTANNTNPTITQQFGRKSRESKETRETHNLKPSVRSQAQKNDFKESV